MPLGTAADLMVGETVVAIGNAFGYEDTVSMGIVSAVKRDVNLNKDMSYKSLIQTDASINPGNSGGPLINVHGELVGVNVAIRDRAQGIGFAIPVDNMIRSVAKCCMPAAAPMTAWSPTISWTTGRQRLVRKVVVKHVDSQQSRQRRRPGSGDVLVQIGDVQIQCGYRRGAGCPGSRARRQAARRGPPQR